MFNNCFTAVCNVLACYQSNMRVLCKWPCYTGLASATEGFMIAMCDSHVSRLNKAKNIACRQGWGAKHHLSFGACTCRSDTRRCKNAASCCTTVHSEWPVENCTHECFNKLCVCGCLHSTTCVNLFLSYRHALWLEILSHVDTTLSLTMRVHARVEDGALVKSGTL